MLGAVEIGDGRRIAATARTPTNPTGFLLPAIPREAVDVRGFAASSATGAAPSFAAGGFRPRGGAEQAHTSRLVNITIQKYLLRPSEATHAGTQAGKRPRAATGR